MSPFVRWVWIILSYLLALSCTAVLCFFSVMVLAGPHGGLLPDSFHKPVLALAWLALLVLPVRLAVAAARRWPPRAARPGPTD